MKFTVDRSKWKNAKHGKGWTNLLNGEGFLCCLGFCQSQLGIPDDHIFGIGAPSGINLRASVVNGQFHEADNIFTRNEENKHGIQCTELSLIAMAINDNEDYSDAERESLLQAAFIEAGHEIEFIGEFQD